MAATRSAGIERLLGRTKGTIRLEYPKNRTIFSQGDPADALFYTIRGRLKLTVVSRQGKSAVIALVDAGDFFGEACLIGRTTRMATATTMTQCLLWRVDKRTAVRLLRRNQHFADHLLKHVVGRTARLEEDLIDQLFNSTEKRLARALLMLAHVGKGNKAEPVIPRVSQETLAAMIGTTRERVSFFMNRFRRLGLIDYNGGLRVRSSLLTVILND
jgi:CRP-like cAMP-binding protein